MEVGGRRGRAKTGVVAGSVWESRMKSDEVKGGIKVYNAEEKPEENADKKTRPKQSPIGVNGKRKTWKSESSDGFERNPIQTPRQRSEPTKDLDQRCKELSVSADGIKVKSPVQPKKTRSEAVVKELSLSVDGIDRNTMRIRKSKSESSRLIGQSDGESDGIERNLIGPKKVQIRKAKSESLKLIGQSDGESDGIERNPIQLRKVKSESNKGLGESGEVSERNPIPLSKAESTSIDGLGGGIEGNSIELEAAKSESRKGGDEAIEEIEKNPVGIQKAGSDGICKEVGVCEEKVISSRFQVKSAPEMVEDENEEEDDDDGDEEDWDEELEEEEDAEIEIDEEKKGVEVVKEIDIKTEEKPKEIDIKTEEKPKEIVNEEKKMHKVEETPKPISPIVKKQVPPPVNHSRTHPIPTKTKSVPVSSGFQKAPETHKSHNKLQSLVDLVMWRDVSKSAFVFGLGTFIIISFSYTKDLNISFITVVSYLVLVYLGAIFLFRSIICRGVLDVDDSSQDYVVGEEEATWLLKMVLPYLNEFLLKFRALFSGDPATTMKLAVLLFVLARCGSSITIWKMGKLGFFGVFTVPKICSSYSTQLTAFGKFWVRRFKDAWETCSHKKAVAFGIFTLVWNLSSVVARIWAVFMLYVAFRYYQQSMMRDDWVQEEPRCETTWQDQIGGSRRGRRRAAAVDLKKEKKRF